MSTPPPSRHRSPPQANNHGPPPCALCSHARARTNAEEFQNGGVVVVVVVVGAGRGNLEAHPMADEVGSNEAAYVRPPPSPRWAPFHGGLTRVSLGGDWVAAALAPQVVPSAPDVSPEVAAPEGSPDDAAAGDAVEGGALGVTDAYDSYCGICRVLPTGGWCGA
jgi:hypothetical protein